MRFGDVFRHPLDTIRATAPGSALIAFNIGMAVAETVLHERSPKGRAVLVGAYAAHGALIAMTARALVIPRLNQKQRLEDLVAEHGYSDRIMESTTETWCSRQVGRVVAENAGKPDEYEALCAARKSESDLTWLPNI